MICFDAPTNPVAIDLAHAALLFGFVASAKPEAVLELGFGAGYSTDVILKALEWNRKGKLTVVDNWCDFDGREPSSTEPYRTNGVEFATCNEEEFVRAAATDAYDILVSDADHHRSHSWLNHHLRIVRPGGFLFFHDVTSSDFTNLFTIVMSVAEIALPYLLFNKSSRPGECCERGWLVVTNQK